MRYAYCALRATGRGRTLWLCLPVRRSGAEENKMMLGILRATAAAIVLAIAVVAAQAQNVADFFKGKNVELYIGYSVGGGYDLWARVLARHIGRHIPGNPTIVV